MKRLIIGCAALAASVAVAEPSGDRPDDRHAWAVHDVNRPDPVKITVPENGVPSDALVLFDGTAESVAKNWRGRDGKASKWTVKDGTFVCAPGSGPAVTAEAFADCQLHIEWKTPVDDVEGWGNSGVIFTGSGRFTSWTAQAWRSSGRSPDGSATATDAASAAQPRIRRFMRAPPSANPSGAPRPA